MLLAYIWLQRARDSEVFCDYDSRNNLYAYDYDYIMI